MKSNVLSLIFLMVLGLFSVSSVHQVFAEDNTLTVNITGFKSSKGKAYIIIFNQPKGYPQDPSKALVKRVYSISPSTRSVVFTVPLAKEKLLAVAAYHDENNNGKLDSNALGIPVEGTGTSNNVKSLFGPPRFKDASFSFLESKTINFKMSY